MQALMQTQMKAQAEMQAIVQQQMLDQMQSFKRELLVVLKKQEWRCSSKNPKLCLCLVVLLHYFLLIHSSAFVS